MEQTEKVIAFGNQRFVIQSLNSTGNGYEADALHIQGLVNFSMDFTQETSPYPADDNPEYVAVNGVPTGSGTATLRGITNEDAARIYPAISGADGVHFGENLPVKYFGLMFDEQVEIDGVRSVNRYVVYKCRATNLPAIATATISGTTITPRDIAIGLAATPIFFQDIETGSNKRRIFSVYNSITNPIEFAALENEITFPA